MIHLLARIERGRPVRIADIVDRLNSTYLDWIFPPAVVADVAVRSRRTGCPTTGTARASCSRTGPYGATIAIEDCSRVDPWIVRQAERERAACRERLAAFSRLDRTSGEG